MDMSHQAYQLEAFDCDNPKEVVRQSIPHSCSVKGLDGTSSTVESESTPMQDYTILQRVLFLNTRPSCVQKGGPVAILTVCGGFMLG